MFKTSKKNSTLRMFQSRKFKTAKIQNSRILNAGKIQIVMRAKFQIVLKGKKNNKQLFKTKIINTLIINYGLI